MTELGDWLWEEGNERWECGAWEDTKKAEELKDN